MESNSTISVASPTGDMVNLILKPINTCLRKKGYWKFNSNLLKNEPFCQEVIVTINDITEDSNFTTYRDKWEHLRSDFHIK